MLVHLGLDAGHILEVAHVAQHVHLVPADGLGVQLLGGKVHVGLGGGEESHPRPGEGDLGGGAEHVDHVGIARLLALLQDIEHRGILVDIVDGVGVVPEDAEVFGGGLESGQAAHRLVGVGAAQGLVYLGTHHMPLTVSSSATSFSTRSMSGPHSVRGMLIISMPRVSQMVKWRS